ncbi:MAG: hypothetical protein ACOCYZ_04185, partial [Halococcoides sp.]
MDLTLSDDSVAPGETVTVEMSATDAATLSLAGIPSDWEIDDYDENDGLPQVVELDDDTQKIQWAWDENKDQEISVTLSIPEDATADETELTAEAEDTDDRMATASGSISVSDDSEPTTDDSETTTDDSETTTDDSETTTDDSEELPTLVEQTDDLAVQPGENVTLSLTYEDTAGIRIQQVPDSWELVDSSSEAFEKDDGDESKVVGAAFDGNESGTFDATYQVPSDASGDYTLPVTLDRFQGENISSSMSVTVDEDVTTTEETTTEESETTTEESETTTDESETTTEESETTTEDPDGPTVSVSDGSVAPGETVTVDVSATDATVLSLAGIPSDWTIDDYDEEDGLPQEVEQDDGAQKIQWAWDDDQDRSVSVTLSIPEDAATEETELTAEAGDTEDRMVTANGTVSVSDESETTTEESETTTDESETTTEESETTTEESETTTEESETTTEDPDGPTVSVTDGSVAPGETVTVDVSATDATVLS